MRNEEIKVETAAYLMDTYARQPFALVKGKGVKVWDADGNEYLDFLAGIAVCCLGHSHPAVIEAITKQAAEIIHTSNLYLIPNQAKLARYLVDLSFGDRAFFCNSGAEANEGAIKLARRYQNKVKKTGRATVLSFHNSFHGRTLATLAATGQAKYRDGFEPIPDGFKQTTYNDLEAVKHELEHDKSIGAVLLEPIQAEGGVIPATKEFLIGLRKLTKEHGVLLIFDEVQTGVGRTGKLFAYQEYDVAPDIMTLAKGLAGGVPIGAVVATQEVASAFVPGTHASTFGGNHLASAAAVAVLKTILNDQLVERAAASGKELMERVRHAKLPCVKEVRGRGLLIGIEIDRPGSTIVPEMLKRGYIIGTAGEKVIRLVPPLIVSTEQCDKIADTLIEVLKR